jgi:hypothetical protein
VVPNAHHLFGTRNPAFRLSVAGQNSPPSNVLAPFGEAILNEAVRLSYQEGGTVDEALGHGRVWASLCHDDVDGDGATNGEELGDPCCTWVPGVVPPYRVWNITNPGSPKSMLTREQVDELSPGSCEAPNDREREDQFVAQYYMRHEADHLSGDGLRWMKYPCFAAIAALLAEWARTGGLLHDLFGVGPRARGAIRSDDLSRLERATIYAAAYLWTDGVAGLTHLTFDFAPRWYPIIGTVATGFQFHHVHPTAWVVVPLPVMLSHSLPLLGLLSSACAVVPQRRRYRAFWSLTMVLCLVTVLTHRWVHTPPEQQYAWFRLLQSAGLLMSHEHHMLHHDSLVTQFSNLSGVTDCILDFIATRWLPPTHYQQWLTITLLYFAVPITLGSDAFAEAVQRRSGRVSVAGGFLLAEDRAGKVV